MMARLKGDNVALGILDNDQREVYIFDAMGAMLKQFTVPSLYGAFSLAPLGEGFLAALGDDDTRSIQILLNDGNAWLPSVSLPNQESFFIMLSGVLANGHTLLCWQAEGPFFHLLLADPNHFSLSKVIPFSLGEEGFAMNIQADTFVVRAGDYYQFYQLEFDSNAPSIEYENLKTSELGLFKQPNHAVDVDDFVMIEASADEQEPPKSAKCSVMKALSDAR